MDLEAFYEQQLDLAEIYEEEHRDPRNQRMIVDTEEEAEALVKKSWKSTVLKTSFLALTMKATTVIFPSPVITR